MILAKLGKSHGLDGWQQLDFFGEDAQAILKYGPLLLLSQSRTNAEPSTAESNPSTAESKPSPAESEPSPAESKPRRDFSIIADDLQLDNIKRLGKKIIAKFTDISTPEAAATRTNLFLGVRRRQLPQSSEGKYYWHDLMGARVISLYLGQEIMLGTLTAMQRLASNDIMEVRGDSKYHYIPFIPKQYVQEVTLSSETELAPPTIKVNWDPDF